MGILGCGDLRRLKISFFSCKSADKSLFKLSTVPNKEPSSENGGVGEGKGR